MEVFHNLEAILEELSADARQINQDEVTKVEQSILKANRIFVAGAGRSGFVARAFANRLMHLGFTVYFVGDPTTPSIRENDVLIIGSGSGTTKGMVNAAETAKKEKAAIVTITIHPDGTIGKMSDAYIKVPGASSRNRGVSEQKAPSIQPNGSSFEQLTWLIYDAIIVDLKKVRQQSQEQMDYRHANME